MEPSETLGCLQGPKRSLGGLCKFSQGPAPTFTERLSSGNRWQGSAAVEHSAFDHPCRVDIYYKAGFECIVAEERKENVVYKHGMGGVKKYKEDEGYRLAIWKGWF